MKEGLVCTCYTFSLSLSLPFHWQKQYTSRSYQPKTKSKSLTKQKVTEHSFSSLLAVRKYSKPSLGCPKGPTFGVACRQSGLCWWLGWSVCLGLVFRIFQTLLHVHGGLNFRSFGCIPDASQRENMFVIDWLYSNGAHVAHTFAPQE